MLNSSRPVRRKPRTEDLLRPYAVGIGSVEQAVDVEAWVETNAKLLRLKKIVPGEYLRKMLSVCFKSFGWHGCATKIGSAPPVEHDPFPKGYEPKLPALTDEVLDKLLEQYQRTNNNLPRSPELRAFHISPSLLGMGGRRNPVVDIEVWLRENMILMRELGHKQWLVEFLHQLRFLMTLPRLLPREAKKPDDPYLPRSSDTPPEPVQSDRDSSDSAANTPAEEAGIQG